MSEAELVAWRGTKADRILAYAARPCADCPASWAAQMAAHGRCNGSPGDGDVIEASEAVAAPHRRA